MFSLCKGKLVPVHVYFVLIEKKAKSGVVLCFCRTTQLLQCHTCPGCGALEHHPEGCEVWALCWGSLATVCSGFLSPWWPEPSWGHHLCSCHCLPEPEQGAEGWACVWQEMTQVSPSVCWLAIPG